MIQVGSQGSFVPSPTRRVQAQSFSQSTVRTNSALTSGGTSAISSSWVLTCSFQHGSLYSRNHWSWRIFTKTLPPHRQITRRLSKSYIGTES